MYCRNCGKEIDERASICVGCGFANGTGTNFCAHCGKPVAPGAAVCVNCGFAVKGPETVSKKSKTVAGLLGIFLGTLGIHNFYLGYTGKAVPQLILGLIPIVNSVSWIWGFVEGILILAGKINKDAQGQLLK